MSNDTKNALIIQGEGGEVYFLGHNDLKQYELSDENAAAVRETLDAAEEAGEVSGFGETGPRVHVTEFASIVYAPVMRGFDFRTATPDAFVADAPPDR